MTIYEKIRFLREKQGLSQQELAEKVGFKTASAINKIELGLRDINQNKIFVFAKALRTTPNYLVGWNDDVDLLTKQNSTKKLFDSIDNLTSEQKAHVFSYIDFLNSKNKSYKP